MILLENVEKNSYVEVAKVSQITEDYYSSDGTKKTITLKLFTNEDQTSLPVTKKVIGCVIRFALSKVKLQRIASSTLDGLGCYFFLL